MAWNDVVGWILLGIGVLWFIVFLVKAIVRRDGFAAYLSAISFLFLPFSMAFFAVDNEIPPDPNLIKIDQCIADGGDPEYTTNRYGGVVHYFGCVGSKES